MTITEDLRGPALAAVRATDPGENRRICAVKHLRDATGGGLLLRELIAAVDWALTQDADLSRHVTGHDPATGRAQYSFPNGHSASVIPDPQARREAASYAARDDDRHYIVTTPAGTQLRVHGINSARAVAGRDGTYEPEEG